MSNPLRPIYVLSSHDEVRHTLGWCTTVGNELTGHFHPVRLIHIDPLQTGETFVAEDYGDLSLHYSDGEEWYIQKSDRPDPGPSLDELAGWSSERIVKFFHLHGQQV